MPDLHLARNGSVVKRTIDDEPAPHAAAAVHPHDWAMPLSRAVQRFTERSDVRIILHENGKLCLRGKPFAEGEIVPSFYVVRALDTACFPIHRPTVADADGGRLPSRDQSWQGFSDFGADAFAAQLAVHREAAAFQDFAAGVTREDLQF